MDEHSHHGYIGQQDDYLRRLRRIEGQVRGLQKMVEDEKYCIDILTQISATTSALQSVALGLLDEHLSHCVVRARPLWNRSDSRSRRPPTPSPGSSAPDPDSQRRSLPPPAIPSRDDLRPLRPRRDRGGQRLTGVEDVAVDLTAAADVPAPTRSRTQTWPPRSTRRGTPSCRLTPSTRPSANRDRRRQALRFWSSGRRLRLAS